MLPGAREVLAALCRPGIVQTTVTGNIAPVAQAKLVQGEQIQHLVAYRNATAP